MIHVKFNVFKIQRLCIVLKLMLEIFFCSKMRERGEEG